MNSIILNKISHCDLERQDLPEVETNSVRRFLKPEMAIPWLPRTKESIRAFRISSNIGLNNKMFYFLILTKNNLKTDFISVFASLN